MNPNGPDFSMSERLPRVLVEAAHPKHLHQFAAVARAGEGRFETCYVVKDKDINLALADAMGLSYTQYGRYGRTLGEKSQNAWRTIRDLDRVARDTEADLILSRSSPYAALLGRTRPFRTMPMPDSEVVPLINYLVAPLSDVVVTPQHYGRSYRSQVRVPGVFEECYLHPLVFRPDPQALDLAKLQPGDPFAFVRFVGWTANHDVGQGGFNLDAKRDLVRRLGEHVRVVVSSETPLPDDLEQHRLSVPVHLAQSLLGQASVYIGDSQSMATEAALLGTPSIRYNSFVGDDDMRNFVVLEEEHGLIRNFSSAHEATRAAVEAVRDGWKTEWTERRAAYFEGRPPLADLLATLVAEAAAGASIPQLRRLVVDAVFS